MAEEQSKNSPPSVSWSEKLTQSKLPQKVIIIKSSPAFNGTKRKLDIPFGSPTEVQKPCETRPSSCSSSAASLITETRGKNIILYNKGPNPLLCTLPKSHVLQNLNSTTVAIPATCPALPKITFTHKKSSQFTPTLKNAVAGCETDPKEPPILPKKLCIDGDVISKSTKPTGKGILILRSKKADGISSNGLLNPVAFSFGSLTSRRSQNFLVQTDYNSRVVSPFLLKDLSKSGLLFPQMAESISTTAVAIANKASGATCMKSKKSEDRYVESAVDITVRNTTTGLLKQHKDEIRNVPVFRQYYAIHCPFHGDFNVYAKYLADEKRRTEGDEINSSQRQPGSLSWSGMCPICCSYCVSVCSSADELFDHLNVHKPWLQFADVACHLCPLDKHLPTMQKLEFQTCSWRNLRLSMLSEHQCMSHDIGSSFEPNPYEQMYDVLIDPAKVSPSSSNSVKFSCPLELAKHMMRHFHVLSCRLVCSLCCKKNNGFEDLQGEGENDLVRLEQHHRQFHPTDRDNIPIVFQLRVRPGRLKKPNQREIANKYKMLLSPVTSCFKPKTGCFSKETELHETAGLDDTDVIPEILCPARSSGCEFRTANVARLTDHVDYHMAAVPLRWRISCHSCCLAFDNFLDAMLHLSQKTCYSMTVKPLGFGSDRIIAENLQDCFSNPSVEEATVNTSSCRSFASDVLAQKYVDIYRSAEVNMAKQPVNYHEIISVHQMGLFLVVQPIARSDDFLNDWAVIKDSNPVTPADRHWLILPSKVRLKKSVALSSNPVFRMSSAFDCKQDIVEDQQLSSVSKTRPAVDKCDKDSSELRTVTIPAHVFSQLIGTKYASNSARQVKLVVSIKNNLQNVAQGHETVALKSKYGSNLKAQGHYESLLLKGRMIHPESVQRTTIPVVDTSKNLNRSAYAEIETLFIGQQYGVNENVKVIIKEIDSDLLYQCPYCVYVSPSIFDVANHLVKEHDNSDLEQNDANSIHLKTHTLLMHCRLCDFVTHHHASLLWHLQDIHGILDEPLTLNNDAPIDTADPAILELEQTAHFRCARFDECAFASVSVAAVVRHSYEAHAGDGTGMFGIGHVTCDKVSFDVHPKDVRITSQFVCAQCHAIALSRKTFAVHYLYEHSSRLLYICMYCEAHLNSLTAIIKHIDYRHAGFERLICSVVFVGDLGEDENTIIRCEQSSNIIDTATPAVSVALPHHCLASVFSVPLANAKFVSGYETGSHEVQGSTSFHSNPDPAGPGVTSSDTASADSTFFANVTQIEGSKNCIVTFKDRELWLPYSILAPLLQRP